MGFAEAGTKCQKKKKKERSSHVPRKICDQIAGKNLRYSALWSWTDYKSGCDLAPSQGTGQK